MEDPTNSGTPEESKHERSLETSQNQPDPDNIDNKF